MLTTFLDIAGLILLVVAAYLLVNVGAATLTAGLGVLWISWSLSRPAPK